MKIHQKKGVLMVGVLVGSLVVIVALLYAMHQLYVKKSYYPMGGEVTIVDKLTSGSEYYIVIEQSEDAYFTLSCSESDYAQVNIGDVVACDRTQSAVTCEGVVHEIRPIQ